MSIVWNGDWALAAIEQYTYPQVYEINTRCWLRDLSEQRGQRITLGQVSDEEIQQWRGLGFTHVWLMGIWETSGRGAHLSQGDERLLRFHAEHFPSLRPEETLGGSPYAVKRYAVPRELGGMNGLARFRKQLRRHGMRLILDFVPNHVALDHLWTVTRPELFVTSAKSAPGFFKPRTNELTATGERRLAHGRDPHFPPWHDTAQLDYRVRATHEIMAGELLRLAELCDGVRCDMAMLVVREVFERTWGRIDLPNGGSGQELEFWSDAIPKVKARQSDFLLIAEVYWDYETRLHDLGFDYTYDKKIYDFLVDHQPAGLRQRLLSRLPESLKWDVHFLENHDERRAATAFARDAYRVAAFLTLTLPGMRLLHEGQLSGARHQLPVQFHRRPKEKPNGEAELFHRQILTALAALAAPASEHRLLEFDCDAPQTTDGNPIFAFTWTSADGSKYLACANYSDRPQSGRIMWPLKGSPSTTPPSRLILSPQHHKDPNTARGIMENSWQWRASPWDYGLWKVSGNATDPTTPPTGNGK